MRERCGNGKNGMKRQKQLLTYLLTNSDLSPSVAQESFHRAVEDARLNYSTPHRKDDKGELPINEFNACFADGQDLEK